MEYFGECLTENELMVKILENSINWKQISKYAIWDKSDIEKYYNNIIWEELLSNRKVQCLLRENNDILDKALEDKTLDIEKEQNRYFITTILAKDKDFIIKWCNNGTLSFKEIMMNRNNNKCDKFKPSEVAKMVAIPKVGDKATLIIGSDRYPYEVVEVSKSGLKINVRELKASPGENFDYYSNQKYIYTSNENAPIEKASMNLIGNYKLDGMTLKIGYAIKYSDPCF